MKEGLSPDRVFATVLRQWRLDPGRIPGSVYVESSHAV